MDKRPVIAIIIGIVGAILLSTAIFWLIGMPTGGYAAGRYAGNTKRKAIVLGALVGILAGSFVSFGLYNLYTAAAFAPSYTWLQSIGPLSATTVALIIALLTGLLGGTALSIVGSLVGQRSFKSPQRASA